MSLNDRCQEALDDLRAGKPVPNTPGLRAFLEGVLKDGVDGTRFLPGIRGAAADIHDRSAPAGVIDREAVDRAVGEVLFNVSNYPRAAHAHLWGRDIGPLRQKVTDAVLAVLPGRTVAQVKAETLREAAETVATKDFLLPRGHAPMGVLVDWLRVRADELEREDKR